MTVLKGLFHVRGGQMYCEGVASLLEHFAVPDTFGVPFLHQIASLSVLEDNLANAI